MKRGLDSDEAETEVQALCQCLIDRLQEITGEQLACAVFIFGEKAGFRFVHSFASEGDLKFEMAEALEHLRTSH